MNFHNLLKRQLKRYSINIDEIDEKYADFIHAVNDAYWQFDDDRNMLERALDLSSDELLQANSEMRAVFQAFPDLFFRLDPHGKILDLRAGNTKDLAIKKEKLLGRRIQDVSEEIIQNKFISALRTVQNNKKPVSIEYLMNIEGKDCYYEARFLPLHNDQIFVIVRNITEKKKAEIALKESEGKYRMFLEASPDPIIVFDAKGYCKFINQAFTKAFGWSYKELLNKKIDYVCGNNQFLSETMIEKVNMENDFTGFETSCSTKDGKKIDISLTASIWYDTEHNPLGSIMILRDITDQKRLERHLIQTHKMEAIGILAGGIAHDFNNLLTGMLGNISLIFFDINPNHPLYERLKNIEQYIMQGADLTKQLLGLAKGGKYEIKTSNINRIIEKSSKMFARTRKEINLITKFQKDIFNVDVDRNQLEQVFLNLFVNSWQAMPGGGDIIIETRNIISGNEKEITNNLAEGNREFVKISITDNGTGIDDNIIEKIFDPFFTTKDLGRGTGLGLASAYGIIKNHDGYIKVRSKKNIGTTFDIFLPASKKDIIMEETDRKRRIFKGNETILIIDDEDLVIDVTVKMLKKFGYNIKIAKSGMEALSLYGKNSDSIDLIILDMIMPNMSGKDTYKKLKEIDPNVKVLLSSGYSIEGEAASLLEMGCKGFIQKPYNYSLLSKKIREILNS